MNGCGKKGQNFLPFHSANFWKFQGYFSVSNCAGLFLLLSQRRIKLWFRSNIGHKNNNLLFLSALKALNETGFNRAGQESAVLDKKSFKAFMHFKLFLACNFGVWLTITFPSLTLLSFSFYSFLFHLFYLHPSGNVCCVFWPAVRCCMYPKAGCNCFFSCRRFLLFVGSNLP